MKKEIERTADVGVEVAPFGKGVRVLAYFDVTHEELLNATTHGKEVCFHVAPNGPIRLQIFIDSEGKICLSGTDTATVRNWEGKPSSAFIREKNGSLDVSVISRPHILLTGTPPRSDSDGDFLAGTQRQDGVADAELTGSNGVSDEGP